MRDGNNRTAFKCTTSTGSSKIRRHPVRLHVVVINPTNPNYFAVGGADRYARIYDVRKVCWGEQSSDNNPLITVAPAHLKGKGPMHITSVAYSHQEELLVSYNDEDIYLFGKHIEVDPATLSTSEVEAFKGHRNARTVKGVSFFGPNLEYVVSGSDCGNIFIWKKKGAELVALFKGDSQVVNCLEPHPYATILATSGIETTAKVWAPIAEDYVPLPRNAQKVMKANRSSREEGSPYLSDIMHVLRLQRRHVQTELASWYSRRGSETGSAAAATGEDVDNASDNDDEVINDYLKVMLCSAEAGPDEDDERIHVRDCNIS